MYYIKNPISMNKEGLFEFRGMNMSVPESIRKVPRPVNTVVQDMGHDGPKRYAVRERKAVRYVTGGNPQPVNGATVGYIIEGRYVPLTQKTAEDGPDSLSYGGAALAYSVCGDIVSDLLAVYPPNDAYSVIALALLKVNRPHISGDRMGSAYRSSFISLYYPGAALSKNSVSDLYRKLGEDGKKRMAFFERRIKAVEKSHHIAVDGMLKQDTSKVNDLSAFSYKARMRGCEEISILYAYDIEKREPICAQVFPGNSIDAVSYRSFIRDNKITKGIIVNDKGFPPNNIRTELEENKDLHYLTPVRRNDARISSRNLLSFEGVLNVGDHMVQFRKDNVSGSMFLYAFRDPVLAAAEERTFLESARRKGGYDQEVYSKKRDRFGLVVYESDLDMTPDAAYSCYAERWKLELVFKAYKNDDCLDRTAVHGDFSIHGSEFVNFISTLITCRILSKAKTAGIFEDMTYGDMMEDLNYVWRRTAAPKDSLPKQDDGYWVHAIPKNLELLVRLGLCEEASVPEPKKPGRPYGSKDSQKKDKPEPAVKRPPGRPRKNPLPDPDAPKRRVGRPRKNPPPDPEAPKRKPGRPRVRPLPNPNQPRRPVGRPRKNKESDASVNGLETP